VPAQLPAGISDFTGRAEQVEELCRLLTSGAEARGPEADKTAAGPGALPVVLVVGSGGLGKTALAVHAAHRVAARFPDGQLYAGLLGATNPADPADILARFLRDLGIDPAHIPLGEEERAAQYRTRLAGKRVLIVLDDAGDAAQVQPILPGSPTCAVLATSRRHMPELVGAKTLDIGVLPPEEARGLFARVAGEGRVRAEPAATDQVLSACAGLPLAVRVAGARLATRGGSTVRMLADRLSDERRRLDELRVGNLAVRASFEVSFASLPRPGGPGGVDPARMFRLLGLWTGASISLPAATALIGQADGDTADALEVLIDAHLLECPAPDTYRFHDLLRVYAADRARTEEAEDDRREAMVRLLTWYLHSAEAAARIIFPYYTPVPLGRPPPSVWPLGFASLDAALAWCEAERAGLAAATRLAGEWGLHGIAWKLPAAAMSFYYRRCYWADWLTTHDIGLACARASGDRLAEAWMLNNLGIALAEQQTEKSVSCLERALALFRGIGDAKGETRAATNVAVAYFQVRRFKEAVAAAQRALAGHRRAGEPYGEGLALDVLGSAYRGLGRPGEGIDHLQQALRIFRELGDQDLEAESLKDLGETYLSMGDIQNCTACLRESVAIWRGIGDRFRLAADLRSLSQAQQHAGDSGEARKLLTEALHLYTELGDQARTAEVQADLLRLAEAEGRAS